MAPPAALGYPAKNRNGVPFGIEAVMSMNQPDHPTAAVSDGREEQLDRSRTQPTAFDVPVRVYGNGSDDSPFYKEALVLFANMDGGVLLLNMPVCDGQLLLITNMATEKDHTCRVRHSYDRGAGKIEVAFEFSAPTMDF
jgi:hypothetical protein